MDAVFEPAGVEWSTVSARLASMRRAVLAAAVGAVALVAGIAVTRWLPQTYLGAVLVAAAGGFGWGWVWIGRNQRSWGYTERAEDLLVRRGVMWRELVVVPYGRMQFVDVTRGPVERLFNLATVQLHTAAAATDARIPGLEAAEAARLRDRLAALGETRTAGL
jgi:uncharacterized protein